MNRHSDPGFESQEPPESTSKAVILFDGVCNLCNGFVNFVFDRDPEGHFKVGSLQSDAATRHLAPFDEDPEALDTVVLIENGRVYTRSTAALRILRHLSPPWPLLYVFLVVPRPLRDWVYDAIATHRYDWFGKRDQCRVPTPELQDRFIE